jgi:hypothetical protein
MSNRSSSAGRLGSLPFSLLLLGSGIGLCLAIALLISP